MRKRSAIASLLMNAALAGMLQLVAARECTAQVQSLDVPESSAINPVVHDCNTIKPSEPRPDELTPPLFAPVTSALLHATLPCDRTAVSPFKLANLQDAFDFYSWLTFVTLIKPADGQPIEARRDAPTFWETWKQLPDVMLADGSEPEAWQVPNAPVVPDACRNVPGKGMIIHLEEETFDQPFKSGPLIDQSGHYALFVILMNQPMFDYILEKRLYNIHGQRAFGPGQVNFPNGSVSKDTTGTVGSMMVKASWKVLSPNDDPSEYHTFTARVYAPASADGTSPATCNIKKLGLIGFHVAHKTVNAHQWIWSTFEHVKNVPDKAEFESKKFSQPHYAFFDKTCMSCAINATPPRPWNPRVEPFPGGFKSQIVRDMNLSPDVVRLNSAFQKILGKTVWANYKLIFTQWPSDIFCAKQSDASLQSDPTCIPVPMYLANSTLETFSQGETPLASSSCIACHGNATTQHIPATLSDFTFILEKAHGAP